MTITTLLNKTADKITLSGRSLQHLQIAVKTINRFTKRAAAERRILTLRLLPDLTNFSTYYNDRSSFLTSSLHLHKILLGMILRDLHRHLLRNAYRLKITRLHLHLPLRLKLHRLRKSSDNSTLTRILTESLSLYLLGLLNWNRLVLHMNLRNAYRNHTRTLRIDTALSNISVVSMQISILQMINIV